MFTPNYKGYDDPHIDWYEEHQIARLNPLEQQAQAWATVYHLDDFTRAENWEKRETALAAFNDTQDVIDKLLNIPETSAIREYLHKAMTELEFVIMRLEV